MSVAEVSRVGNMAVKALAAEGEMRMKIANARAQLWSFYKSLAKAGLADEATRARSILETLE